MTNKCRHLREVGDNYGVSCLDCGERLSGYGYGGFFGANLTPEKECIHEFLETGDGWKVCIYCQCVRPGVEETS